MLHSKKISIMMTTIVIILCAFATATAQLPTLTITTRNGQTPTHSPGTGNCANTNQLARSNLAPDLRYIEMTGFSISGSRNRIHDTTVAVTSADSIRRRGNSTAQGGSMGGGMFGGGLDKIPFRVKFDKRIDLFGLGRSKSWALIANYYDPSLLLNALAFELGDRMGLQFSRRYTFVRLIFNGQDAGVYMLTPQISGNQYAGINVDIDDGGWLAEFDYHGASDATDCHRFFVTDQFDLNTKIRAPERDELDTLSNGQPDLAGYNHVKADINAFLNALHGGGTSYRSMVDLDSWAKYVLVQLFMDNFDFNNKTVNGAPLGSNYAYRVHRGARIAAGPLWDFDLAAGVAGSGGFGLNFLHFQNYTDRVRPAHPFYQRLWDDNTSGGFLDRYVTAWNTHKEMIRNVAAPGGLIDSLANLIAPSINGNVANFTTSQGGGGGWGWGGGFVTTGAVQFNETMYRSYINDLKSWWNSRFTYFDQQMPPPVSGPIVPTTYTVAVTRSPEDGGNVSITPSAESYTANTRVTVTATPNAAAGYSFTGWMLTGGSVGGGNVDLSTPTIQFTISTNVSLVANFAKAGDVDIPTCTGNNCIQIIVHAGDGGTVSPSGTISYSSGSTARLRATPSEGYRFVNWVSASGNMPSTTAPSATSEEITFTVFNARTIIANFAAEGDVSVRHARRQPNASSVMVSRNAVNLSVNENAVVRIFNLHGREIRRIDFSRGNHVVRLGNMNMPRGVYVVKVAIDGRMETVRVPVR